MDIEIGTCLWADEKAKWHDLSHHEDESNCLEIELPGVPTFCPDSSPMRMTARKIPRKKKAKNGCETSLVAPYILQPHDIKLKLQALAML